MAVSLRPPAVKPVERGRFPHATGIATVVERRELSPTMARLTLVCAGFAGLPVEQPGEIITLLWPAEGRELILPSGGWRFPPEAGDQHARNYTVRSHDPERASVEVDFFLHGDHGRASRWALRAGPGDWLGWAGPRTHWEPSFEIEWAVLVGDETGAPALAAILESLPDSVPATALIEVGTRADRFEIASREAQTLRWLERDGGEPGTTNVLADAFLALGRPSGAGIVWGGGEAAAMTAIRRHARDAWGLPADRTKVLGYWKHRTTDDWE
ncbi:siderophore-interacting protein [Thermoleophilia bacterium SCSIO 60948]|nr:siderophore-interacting protein [Thermoleophilia bacterium SCSIO 60948]